RQVLEHIEALRLAAPQTAAADEVRAQLMVVQGRAEEAEEMLAHRCDDVIDRVNCLRARSRIAALTKTPGKLAAALKVLIAVGCRSSSACADTMVFAGDLHAQRLDWRSALAAYDRAVDQDPTPERWLRVADSATKVGAHARAIEALEHAASGKNDPE